MNNEFEGCGRERAQHLPGETEENYKTAIRISGVPGKNQTNLLNTGLVCYCHTDLPSFIFLWCYLMTVAVLTLCNILW